MDERPDGHGKPNEGQQAEQPQLETTERTLNHFHFGQRWQWFHWAAGGLVAVCQGCRAGFKEGSRRWTWRFSRPFTSGLSRFKVATLAAMSMIMTVSKASMTTTAEPPWERRRRRELERGVFIGGWRRRPRFQRGRAGRPDRQSG